jgi:hypothetical protein
MPSVYHINKDEGLITVQIQEQVDLVEVFETARDLHDHADYDPALPLLVDLRSMRLALEGAALKPFNRYIIGHFGKTRSASIAVVVDHEMNRDLCAAIYWLNCAVTGCEMFEDYDMALKWLIRRDFATALERSTMRGAL